MKTIESGLVDKYNQVYGNGENNFWTFLPIEERIKILSNNDFRGKDILEVGCGTGDFAAWMSTSGAGRVVAMDASTEAINQAIGKYNLPNLIFCPGELANWRSVSSKFDFVVMVGVLEHTKRPAEILKLIYDGYLKEGGKIITTSPCFANTRGAVWLTLQELFDAPMSLTDRHFFSKNQMIKLLKDSGFINIYHSTVDHGWGYGKRFYEDFQERLPKVLPDIPTKKINNFLKILCDHIGCSGDSGANAVYTATR